MEFIEVRIHYYISQSPSYTDSIMRGLCFYQYRSPETVRDISLHPKAEYRNRSLSMRYVHMFTNEAEFIVTFAVM